MQPAVTTDDDGNCFECGHNLCDSGYCGRVDCEQNCEEMNDGECECAPWDWGEDDLEPELGADEGSPE